MSVASTSSSEEIYVDIFQLGRSSDPEEMLNPERRGDRSSAPSHSPVPTMAVTASPSEGACRLRRALRRLLELPAPDEELATQALLSDDPSPHVYESFAPYKPLLPVWKHCTIKLVHALPLIIIPASIILPMSYEWHSYHHH